MSDTSRWKTGKTFYIRRGVIMAKLFPVILLTVAQALGQSFAAGNPSVADYPKEAFVVENVRSVFTFENDGTSRRAVTSSVRLQSEAGVQHWGILSVAYSAANEHVQIDYVRVRKADGTLVETPADGAEDVTSEIMRAAPMYSDNHEKHIAVKGLGIGDLLEYQITTITDKPLVPGQFWLAYDFEKTSVVLNEEVEVSLPLDREIKVKSPDGNPAIVVAGNRRIYTWKTSNHEVQKNDEPRREFPPPGILLTSFKSWGDLGRWWNGLEGDRVKPTPEISAKAVELTRNATTREEKVRAIYNYVATRFHYISVSFGIGRYQPHAAAEVLKNEYGDCKDKHTLFASLLESVGIDAYPALMNSSRHIDPDVPMPGQFDHVITVVPEKPGGNKPIWLDTTSEVAPFGLLVFLLRDKQALVVPPNAPPSIETTPPAPPFEPFQRYEIDAKLSDAGVLEGKVKRTFRGDSELVAREAFRQTPESRWKDLVQLISRAGGFGGDVSEIEASSPEATNDPYVITYKYTRKDYSDWPNRRITPPIDMINLPEISDTVKRTQPILLGGTDDMTFVARVELPKGYVPRLPEDVDLDRAYAEFHSSYKFHDGVLVAEVEFSVKQCQVPLSSLESYRSFQKGISDAQNRYTELSGGPGSPFGPAASPNAEATNFLREAQAAIMRRDLRAASDSLQKAVQLDDHYQDAWIALGAVKMGQGNLDEGIDALRKAADLDSQDLRGHRMLASLLARLGRSDEAVATWRETLKRSPNDIEAHQNLGGLLFYLKRYREAIPELEAAVAVDKPPESAKVSLAQAYLEVGNTDKAVPIFRQVGEATLNTDTWNSIAYSLADHNIDLTDAQKFAEKAVQSVETDAAQVSLDKLQLADLDRMTQMANDWDTLGWVYFRQSNTPKAQQYIEAAWNLFQDYAMGDHLAQIYEKQGKESAAEHQHTLAQALTGSGGFRFPPVLRHREGDSEPSSVQRISPVEELSEMRRTKLGDLSAQTGSAEFFVLIAPGGKVEGLKFIKGDEQSAPVEKAIRSIGFKAPLPGNSVVRLVRRGVLTCARGRCDFTLFTVDSVRSVN